MLTARQPCGVSFSSGGVRIVGHLGALARLLEAGALNDVTDWYGCSGGSFCAFFGALGVSAPWLRDAIEYFDTRVIASIEDDLVTDFMNSWCVNSGQGMISFLGRFVETWEPGSSTWTFADAKERRPGIRLHITATNVSRGCLTVFNSALTPNMKIMDAVRASSAIPCFFKPWISPAGDLFCDGAVLEYFPWSCVRDKANTLVITGSDTEIGGRPRAIPVTLLTLSDYIGNLMKLIQQMQSYENPRNWIAVNNKSISSIDFHMTREERISLFDEGGAAASGWLAFRQRILCEGTLRSPASCEDRCTLSSGRLSPDKTSDNRQSQSPLPLPYPFRGSRTENSRRGRRWSL